MSEFLIGEPLPLDLVNTRTADADLLDTPEQLGSWLALESLPGKPEDLAYVRELRDHIAAVLTHARAGTPPPPASLQAINAAQHAAPAVDELHWNGTAVVVQRRRAGSQRQRLLALLAEGTAQLLGDPGVPNKVKECEAGDCVMLFLPANPRRRWCSPERCGNRVRVARHYHRAKA